MTMNYNGSQVGVPYVRVHKITIDYPDKGLNPSAVLEQSLGVKLADGTIHKLQDLQPIGVTFDFAADGTTPLPLISPEDASHLGANTTLQEVMLGILAVVRSEQIKSGQ